MTLAELLDLRAQVVATQNMCRTLSEKAPDNLGIYAVNAETHLGALLNGMRPLIGDALLAEEADR